MHKLDTPQIKSVAQLGNVACSLPWTPGDTDDRSQFVGYYEPTPHGSRVDVSVTRMPGICYGLHVQDPDRHIVIFDVDQDPVFVHNVAVAFAAGHVRIRDAY